jgi:hypothetical protein
MRLSGSLVPVVGCSCKYLPDSSQTSFLHGGLGPRTSALHLLRTYLYFGDFPMLRIKEAIDQQVQGEEHMIVTVLICPGTITLVEVPTFILFLSFSKDLFFVAR